GLSHGARGDMVSAAALWAALDEVKDPEIPPVSLVDMGLIVGLTVQTGGRVAVELTPTFVGCPALSIIKQNVTDALMAVAGVAAVEVRFVFDPPWTSERITERGRERLRSFGIAPPVRESGGLLTLTEVPPCPFCGSGDTHMENLFGPTACRAIYYCDACRQPFEAMKTV
ncbi:MAG TPA: 1,2-phenylacetyl-CoA epoxidase subunit PaaD, partial [Symbiobacteriaceae bacterium]|nr:1,2-phenylacetyl-CoA epoxidase subunit PaaD [Symbiobacteriaceae bacterium]